MIPNVEILTAPIEEVQYRSRTYGIIIPKNRIGSDTDALEAVAQAVYLILNTERYKFPIYSWDYGVELNDLYGKPMPYVMSEIPRRVTDALTADDRITDVTDFEFEQDHHVLHCTFTVVSNVGRINQTLEVQV